MEMGRSEMLSGKCEKVQLQLRFIKHMNLHSYSKGIAFDFAITNFFCRAVIGL